MATKTPTLDSYTASEIDVTKYPRAYGDAPDEFYDMLYRECERVADALVTNLPTTHTENGYIIDFDRARFTDYEDAIDYDPPVVLQALVSACHMTERIVREHLGIESLYRFADENAEIRGEFAIQAFISRGCLKYLTGETPLETVLLLYFRSQERNRIQHARGAFYKDVHKTLQKNGFDVKKDQAIPGQPNLVVNSAGSEGEVELTGNAVAGKALRAKPNDVSKRARAAATCCGELKKEAPTAKRVVIFNISGEPFPNDRVREKWRDRIMSQNPDAIDAVFFADETEEFISFCDEHITVFGESTDQSGARKESHDSLDAW